MRLEIIGETNDPNLIINGFWIKVKDGKEIFIDFDESQFGVDDKGNFGGYYKGVYFNDEYANGKINRLANAEITEISFDSRNEGASEDITDFHFTLSEVIFYDDNESLEFTSKQFGPYV